LPESQLDRFLMRIDLGYPDARSERALLQGSDRRSLIAQLKPCMNGKQLATLQENVRTVHASAALLDYLQALLEFTRHSPLYDCGLSPRAGLALLHSAQAWALMEGRDYAMPEDLQVVLPSVVGHRLHFARSEMGAEPSSPAQQLLDAVAIP